MKFTSKTNSVATVSLLKICKEFLLTFCDGFVRVLCCSGSSGLIVYCFLFASICDIVQ